MIPVYLNFRKNNWRDLFNPKQHLEHLLNIDFTSYLITINNNGFYYTLLNSAKPKVLDRSQTNPGELKLIKRFLAGKSMTILIVENKHHRYILAKAQEISLVDKIAL